MQKILRILAVLAFLFSMMSFAHPAAAQAATETRIERLIRFDAVWRSGTPQQWVAQFASGPTALARMDARQPEEEPVMNPATGTLKMVVVGVQVKNAQGLYLPWPSCLTTDQPSRVVENASTRKFTPDPVNGSTLYTEVTVSGDGLVTVYADCSNWGQLVPSGEQPAPVVEQPAPVVEQPAPVVEQPAPDGFCTTPPPANPGWQIEGTVSLPTGCPETGQWAMSMNDQVSRFSTWTEMQTVRGSNKATLYFEGMPDVAPASNQAGQSTQAAPIQPIPPVAPINWMPLIWLAGIALLVAAIAYAIRALRPTPEEKAAAEKAKADKAAADAKAKKDKEAAEAKAAAEKAKADKTKADKAAAPAKKRGKTS